MVERKSQQANDLRLMIQPMSPALRATLERA
jgi:hypothetical protein